MCVYVKRLASSGLVQKQWFYQDLVEVEKKMPSWRLLCDLFDLLDMLCFTSTIVQRQELCKYFHGGLVLASGVVSLVL